MPFMRGTIRILINKFIMGRGRPKKPKALKRLNGTYREDRELEHPMDVDSITSAVEVPKSLDRDEARNLWGMLTTKFSNLGMLSELDLPLLEVMCKEYQRYLDYEDEIEKKGDVVILKNKSGHKYPKENPYLKLREKALNRFVQIACKFGLTPSDRSSIIMGDDKSKKDPLEEHLSKKTA